MMSAAPVRTTLLRSVARTVVYWVGKRRMLKASVTEGKDGGGNRSVAGILRNQNEIDNRYVSTKNVNN
ncbi:hypothetical protein AZ09_00150 [Acetobacter aceti 1023]|nr:hypothetical protein AZ09_00150 [Acetobacter aceti 1023]